MATSSAPRAPNELLVETVREVEDKYDIEYGGYLSNHFVHGLVAARGIGADPQRLEQFKSAYAEHELFGNTLEPAKPCEFVINDANFLQHLHKRSHFQEYRQFFLEKLKEQSRRDVITKYLPLVFKSFSGSAVHPLIQLGFALDIEGDDTAVASGLAYFCYAIEGVELDSVPVGDYSEIPSDPLQALALLSEDESVQTAPYPDSFQQRLLHSATARSRAYAHAWPAEAVREEDEASLEAAVEQLMRTAVCAFLATGASDFFVLHGVTGAYALHRVLPYVDSLSERARFVGMFWEGFVHVYVAQGKPPVDAAALELRCPLSWEEVSQKMLDTTNDEHMLKIVYVCKKFEEEFGKPDEGIWKSAAALAKTGFVDPKIWTPSS